MSRQTHIRDQDRETLVDWLISFQVECKMCPETLFITVNIIDRYLSKENIRLSKFQLLGITALWIASKFQEIYPPVMKDLVEFSDNLFDSTEILEMESKVLTAIEFDINCTPSQTFLENYSRAINVDEPQVLFYASYLLDLALIKAEFLRFRTSHITVCALAIAMFRAQQATRQCFQGKLRDLEGLMRLEKYDPETFQQCKTLFDYYRKRHVARTYSSLVHKYAETGVVNFNVSD